PLNAGVERRLSVRSGVGYPSTAGAVALNLTVVAPAAAGYVTVYPCGARPLASTVNYTAGEIVPNFTLAPYTSGEVCLFSMTDTNVVVDSFGWSKNDTGLKLASHPECSTRAAGLAGPPARPARRRRCRC